MMTTTFAAIALLAQVPNPTPAINAAKDARAKTETAQQKNAEALPPQAPASAQAAPAALAAPGAVGAQGAPGAPAPAGAQPAQAPAGAQPPQTPEAAAGYSYDPAGRRDPFVSLNARGGELPVAGVRPAGAPGLLISEVTVKGIFKSPKGGFLALLQAPDGRTYTVKQSDKVFDGSVRAITADTVVFSQDVNDPLSLVKQREVRKSIRPEAR